MSYPEQPPRQKLLQRKFTRTNRIAPAVAVAAILALGPNQASRAEDPGWHSEDSDQAYADALRAADRELQRRATKMTDFGDLSANERLMLSKALSLWEPIAMGRIEGSLLVVLPQDRITMDILSAVVISGVCFGQMAHGYEMAFTEVAVLNRYSHQGYVWEGNLIHCEVLNEMPAADASREVLFRSRLH